MNEPTVEERIKYLKNAIRNPSKCYLGHLTAIKQKLADRQAALERIANWAYLDPDVQDYIAQHGITSIRGLIDHFKKVGK